MSAEVPHRLGDNPIVFTVPGCTSSPSGPQGLAGLSPLRSRRSRESSRDSLPCVEEHSAIDRTSLIDRMPANYVHVTTAWERKAHEALYARLEDNWTNVELAWEPLVDRLGVALHLAFLDRPGSLSAITAALAECNINILSMSAFCTDTGVAIDTLEISRFDETAAKTVIARMGCGPPESDKRASPPAARADVLWHDEVLKTTSSSSSPANLNRSPASSRPGSLHGGDAWLSSSRGGSLHSGEVWASSRSSSMHGGDAWAQRYRGWNPPRQTDRGYAASQTRFQDLLRNLPSPQAAAPAGLPATMRRSYSSDRLGDVRSLALR